MSQTQDRHPYAPVDEPPAQGQQQQQQSASQQARQELPTIQQAKKQVCDRLNKIFTSPLMQERLLRMAGGDASRVAKNLTAFLSVITQDDGGSANNKKYYYQCSIQSLVTCFLESMNMQLPFDSRKLVSMVIYDWEAELDISYKGFVNALNKHYRDAYVDAKLVFKDDLFECEESGGKVVFRHVAKDNFRTVNKNFDDIVGGYCYFSYSLASGEKVSRIVRMTRDDILKVRSKAKTKNVWDEFPSEMGIKAIIRRGSKIPFAAIDLDVDIEEVANRHYALDKPGDGDRLKLLMQAQEEVVHGNPQNPPADSPAEGAGNTDEKNAAASPGTVLSQGAPAGEKPANPTPAPAPAPQPSPAVPAAGNPATIGQVDEVKAPPAPAPAPAAVGTSPAAAVIDDARRVADISEAEFEEVKS